GPAKVVVHVGAMGDVDIVAPFPTGAAALEEEQVAVDRERRPALDICAVDSGAQIDGCLPRAFRSGAVRDPEIGSAESPGPVGSEVESQTVSRKCRRALDGRRVDGGGEVHGVGPFRWWLRSEVGAGCLRASGDRRGRLAGRNDE